MSKDENTGLYYYGARYYDPRISLWHGVDPLAEDYPGWSTFAYTMNNPITYWDPTGMNTEDGDWHPDENGNLVADAGDNVHTLAQYQGISVAEAQQQLDNNGICNVNECDVVNTGSYNLPEVTVTASRTNYQASIDNFADKGDFFSGSTALVPGSFRITNGSYNGNSFSPKYYSSGWTGGSRASISAYNIGKMGNAAGSAFFILGTVNDGIGVYNYYQNPSAQNSNAVHPGKAGLNLGIGVYGMYINPIPAVIYGGLEAFYPGGAAGAMEVQSRNIENNRKIIKYYGPFITGKL